MATDPPVLKTARDLDNKILARFYDYGYFDKVMAALDHAPALGAAIRAHRDARGDDRCWRDDETLYAVLPEGYTPPERDTAVELARCQQFIASRQHPQTVYVSPQAEIDRFRAALERYGQHDALCIQRRLRDDGPDRTLVVNGGACTCGLAVLLAEAK